MSGELSTSELKSVHAAHAVDGNFFDELKFFCDYFDI